jgi:glycyl-tRNA synthetase beta chain
MADFLLELLSEEVPARMQARARNDLARMFAEDIERAGLTMGALDVHSTPRRLVLIARDVADATHAAREEVKGPRASAPAQALEGFLRKTGVARGQLEERDGVLFAVIDRPGRPAAEVIAEAVPRILGGFPWPKSMRWGAGAERWVRPLQGIVAMLGEEIVPVEFAGVTSGATTVGHRFHHPGAITIGGASDYAEKLRACHVIVDQDEREKLIRQGAETAANDAGLQLICDEGLVVENAGLTEWPVPLLGRFDPEFLDVPREVIVLTMRTNQKYFAVADDTGVLAPAFVCVANIDATDGGAAIVEGNKRVLAARLADARFFWEQDLKVPLDEQAKELSGIVFHEKLGTVADKVERVAKLARWLVEEGIILGADPEQVERAARLAKADLVTGMVGEFPELQGVIGGYLARAQGEPNAIADAVRDHYKPVGQGDEVPTQPVTVAVALADKLDTVLSLFCVGELPTGSRDPFALRRSCLGAIRLILHNNLRLKLSHAIELLREMLYSDVFLGRYLTDQMKLVGGVLSTDPNFHVAQSAGGLTLFHGEEPVGPVDSRVATTEAEWEKFQETLWSGEEKAADFFNDRLKVQQREFGTRHDIIDAVFALTAGPFVTREDDLVRLLARVRALQGFVETEDGGNLLIAYKRAANILKREKWEEGKVDSRFRGNDELEAEEQALIAALDAAEPKASAAVEAEDFTRAMAALASLRAPIDTFFDHVTVNDPDPDTRARRLNLLLRFRDAVHRVADFSKIEG